MNRPLDTAANPAEDMAVIKGVRENMGNIPVPRPMRLVAVAMAVSWVKESRPAPSVIQISP
jgi:hypothetical protein